MKDLSILIFIPILFFISSGGIYAQSISWGPSSANNLEVLYSSNTVTFEFTNGNIPLTNAKVKVQLGVGIEYIYGNLSYTSSGSAVVTEGSFTGANLVNFNIGALGVFETVSITFSRRANCSAKAHKIAAGIFEDVVKVYEGNTEVIYMNNGGEPNNVVYDVTYGNLVVSAPTHLPSSSTSVGETVTRSIKITNGNFGTVTGFWVEDDYEDGNVLLSNFKINGNSIPGGNVSDFGDRATITFDGSVIENIDGSGGTFGDGDNLFEKDEYFILTYDVTLLQCGTNSLVSHINAFYGSNENSPCPPIGSNTTTVTVTNGTPEITLVKVSNPKNDFCGSTNHVVRLTNSGTDPEDFAKDVVIFIGLRGNWSAIATLDYVSMWGSSYRGTKHFTNFTINGNPIAADSILGIYSSMVDYIPFDYFTTDPDGPGIGLEDLDGDGYYDDLASGESIDVGFDVTLEPRSQDCGGGRSDYIFWEHISVDAEVRNQCGVNQVAKRTEINYHNFIRNYQNSTFVEGPADVNDGDKFEVKINPHLYIRSDQLSCNGGNVINGPDVTWTLKCVLPPGVSLQSGATTDPHFDAFNPSIWQSNDTVFYEIDRYNRDWFTFPLELDCSKGDNSNKLSFDLISTYKCGSCWEMDVHCESFSTTPHCPGSCIGVTTTGFLAQRTTPGWTNDNKTTPVTLTPGVHAMDKLLPFDNFQMIATGGIHDTISDNLHLRIKYTPEVGDNIFDYVDGEITIYDIDGAYGNTTFTFPISTDPSVTSTNTGGIETYFWDLDLSSYIRNVHPSYVLGQGVELDSFKVILNAVYNKNAGSNLYAVNNFRAEFFMIDGNLSERSCNSYGTPLFYSGFGHNGSGNIVQMNGCAEKDLIGYFSWYNYTGDIFPNEYRPVQQIDSIIVTIPEGAKFVGIPNSGASMSGTLSYYEKTNGDVVVYPNSDYKPLDWRSTFWPRMPVKVKPTCELESGNHVGELEFFRTVYNYHPDASFHEQVTTKVTNRPLIQYVKPTVSATPLNQVMNGIADTVQWEIQACNATSGLDVDYNWVVLDNSTSSGITVKRVLDIGGSEIPITDYGNGKIFVPLGAIAGGDCTHFTVVADYTSCNTDNLYIDFGWDCDAYPTSLADLPECNTSTFVTVVPVDAAMAATITALEFTPSNPSNPDAGVFQEEEISLCVEFPVEFKIISSSNATLYDINFDLILPNNNSGLSYVANSATIEIEGVDALNTPRLIDAAGEAIFLGINSGTTNISLADIDAANFGNDQGLVGAGNDPNKNEIIIRFMMKASCDVTSVRSLRMSTYSNSACGEKASGNGEIIYSSILPAAGPYSVHYHSNISPINSTTECSDSKLVALDIHIIGGPTGENDILNIPLFPGVTYNGNYDCTSVYCPSFMGTKMVNGNEVVMFKYPPGIQDRSLSIEFEIGTLGGKRCSGQLILCYEVENEIE